ncbi:putative villin/Gelsolin, ADF-H/Gelsolin-like domain superfamily [Helianthus debilis subsp. tardiflorus]
MMMSSPKGRLANFIGMNMFLLVQDYIYFCVFEHELCIYICITTLIYICSIDGGKVGDQIEEYSKSSFETDKCYLMDCGFEVFVWVGRATQVDDRKAATQAAEVKIYKYQK